MNGNETQLAATLTAAILAVIGAVVSKILESKTRKLSTKLDIEVDFTKQLLGRVETLEFQLHAAVAAERKLQEQVNVLRQSIHDREIALKELGWKYEALQVTHNDLSERYRIMREELIQTSGDRKTVPPPAPREPWPKKKEGKQ